MQTVGRLEGKVAVITGGASGIGREIARRFVAEGARVTLGDLDVRLLGEAARELGPACTTLEANVTVEDDVERLVAAAIDAFGRLDVGVNCAGLSTFGPIAELSEGDWNLTVDVCLTGVFLSVKHEARRLLAQGEGGSIINIASLNAVQPAEGMSAYCASKAGIDMLTRCAALELGPHGIRVNAIGPGLIDTPLTQFQRDLPGIRAGYLENIPLGRVGTTQDVASAALFLASEESSWVTGDLLLVDGGARTKRYPEMFRLIAEGLADLEQQDLGT